MRRTGLAVASDFYALRCDTFLVENNDFPDSASESISVECVAIKHHQLDRAAGPPVASVSLVKIYIGLVNYEQGSFRRLGNESQHLTPNLKSKSSPIKFARHPIFWAEHIESCRVRVAPQLWLLNIHSGPCLLDHCPKLRKTLRKWCQIFLKFLDAR